MSAPQTVGAKDVHLCETSGGPPSLVSAPQTVVSDVQLGETHGGPVSASQTVV